MGNRRGEIFKWAFSSTPVLDTKTALGICPFNRIINAGNHTSTTLQTADKFHLHHPFLIKRIEICRAGINAKPLFAALTDLLVEVNVGFFIVFKGIKR
jgi:hypothetical protein